MFNLCVKCTPVSGALSSATYTCTSAADSRVSACAASSTTKKTVGAAGATDTCTATCPANTNDETAEDKEVFGSRAKMAKEGLQLLMNETNMSVQMIDDMSDWLFLLSLCDPYVKDGGMRIGTEVIQEPKVTNEMLNNPFGNCDNCSRCIFGQQRHLVGKFSWINHCYQRQRECHRQ